MHQVALVMLTPRTLWVPGRAIVKLWGLKQCKPVLPSPALAPKGNSVNITLMGSAGCGSHLMPCASCGMAPASRGRASCPVIMFCRMADTIPGALRSVSHTNRDCRGPCECWTGRFGLWGVGLREAALSTAALSSYRGGLVLNSAFPKTSAQLLILVGLQPMVGAGPSQRFF